mmetsp:Transcript_37232/g.91655  ORF Transcript_37232/g.91655 Transcript_37232/m.91655 type:complete len:454 (-) Transcript_37232:580-1941(-)
MPAPPIKTKIHIKIDVTCVVGGATRSAATVLHPPVHRSIKIREMHLASLQWRSLTHIRLVRILDAPVVVVVLIGVPVAHDEDPSIAVLRLGPPRDVDDGLNGARCVVGELHEHARVLLRGRLDFVGRCLDLGERLDVHLVREVETLVEEGLTAVLQGESLHLAPDPPLLHVAPQHLAHTVGQAVVLAEPVGSEGLLCDEEGLPQRIVKLRLPRRKLLLNVLAHLVPRPPRAPRMRGVVEGVHGVVEPARPQLRPLLAPLLGAHQEHGLVAHHRTDLRARLGRARLGPARHRPAHRRRLLAALRRHVVEGDRRRGPAGAPRGALGGGLRGPHVLFRITAAFGGLEGALALALLGRGLVAWLLGGLEVGHDGLALLRRPAVCAGVEVLGVFHHLGGHVDVGQLQQPVDPRQRVAVVDHLCEVRRREFLTDNLTRQQHIELLQTQLAGAALPYDLL